MEGKEFEHEAQVRIHNQNTNPWIQIFFAIPKHFLYNGFIMADIDFNKSALCTGTCTALSWYVMRAQTCPLWPPHRSEQSQAFGMFRLGTAIELSGSSERCRKFQSRHSQYKMLVTNLRSYIAKIGHIVKVATHYSCGGSSEMAADACIWLRIRPRDHKIINLLKFRSLIPDLQWHYHRLS